MTATCQPDYQTFNQRRTIEDAIIYFGQRNTDQNFAGQEEYHLSELEIALYQLRDTPEVSVGTPKGKRAQSAGKALLNFYWPKTNETTGMTMDPAIAEAAAAWWDFIQTA